MKKADFCKSGDFFCVVVAAIVPVLGNGELLQGLERKTRDPGITVTAHTPSARAAVIDKALTEDTASGVDVSI